MRNTASEDQLKQEKKRPRLDTCPLSFLITIIKNKNLKCAYKLQVIIVRILLIAIFIKSYLTIILRGRAGYQVIDNQRGA